MGPYGSVGAHIKTGESSMAQDHFKTPPDPKKGHEMTKNPQKSKKYSRVGQDMASKHKTSNIKLFVVRIQRMLNDTTNVQEHNGFLSVPRPMVIQGHNGWSRMQRMAKD